MKPFIIFSGFMACILPFQVGATQTTKLSLPVAKPEAESYRLPRTPLREELKEFQSVSIGSVRLRKKDEYDGVVGDPDAQGPRKIFGLILTQPF